MADVGIRATITGFTEGRAQLQGYLDGLQQLKTQVTQLQGKFGDAVSGGDFAAAQQMGTQLQQLNTQVKDLQVNISRLTPDAQGLNAQQKEMGAVAATASDGLEKVGAAGMHAGLGSAYARREVLILGREIMEGNFSRIPGTLVTLAAHTGVFTAAWIAVAAPVLAAAAAVGALIYAVSSATKEMFAMNNALTMTNNFAGMTRGEMNLMAESISKAGTLTVGTTRDMITQIVATGRYGADNIGLLTKLAENYGATLGESADKALPKFIKLFEDPSKAAETLNQQYHFLSVEEEERIRTLQRTGQEQEAVTLLMEKFSAKVPEAKTQLNDFAFAWDHLKQIISGAKDALATAYNQMAGNPNASPIEQQVKDKQAEINKLYNVGATQDDPRIKMREQELVVLVNQMNVQKQLNAEKAAATVQAEKEAEAQKLVWQTLQYQNKELQDKLTKAANIKDPAERAQVELDIRKKIADNEHQQAAYSNSFIQERYAGEQRLLDIQTKRQVSEVESLVKLGRLSQEDADVRIMALKMNQNLQQQMFVQEEMKAKGILPLEKEKLQYKLEQLQAESQSIAITQGQKEQLDIQNKDIKEITDNYKKMQDEMKLATEEQKKQGLQVQAFGVTTAKMIEEEQFKTSLIGKTTEQQTLLTALHKLDLDYAKESVGLDDAHAASLKGIYDSARLNLQLAVNDQAIASKEVNQFWKTAAKDMQRAMSTFFFDVMQGNTSNLLANFKTMIDRMVADALAAKAALALFGPDFAKAGSTAPIGGWAGQALNWLGFSGMGGSTTMTPAAVTAYGDSALSVPGALGFAGGGSFTVGGSGGTDSKMVGFKATPGEQVTVTPPGQRASNAKPAIHFNGPLVAVYANDVTSFNKSRGQMGAEMYTLANNFARRFT